MRVTTSCDRDIDRTRLSAVAALHDASLRRGRRTSRRRGPATQRVERFLILPGDMPPRRTMLLTLLKLTDLMIVAACLAIAGALGAPAPLANAWRSPLQMQVTVSQVLLAAAYLVLWHVVLSVRGLYHSYRLSPVSRELRDLVTAIALATAPLVLAGFVLGFDTITPAFLVAFVAATT